ncbi:unnamed protein product [Oikopleura dioica]|uniref:Sec16 Sec23-binding domain-containing protein n=1 Tax=Oikopleura dioica TaxID=34765 RepID=E4XGQ5_OIKDI|nr:unnamed protein product [Oikopleura dioica]
MQIRVEKLSVIFKELSPYPIRTNIIRKLNLIYGEVYNRDRSADKVTDYDAEWQDNFYVDSARDEGRKTPPKFTQPHCIVRFSPTGQLVKVNAARVDEGEAATFELHSLEALTANEPVFAPGLHAYPGPLTRSATPKIDVVRYCESETCDLNEYEPELDRQSFALLWDLLALLVRSNDNAEGHDFSELLLGELKTEKQSDEAEESNLEVKADRSVINEANSSASLRNLTTGRGYSETEKVNRFRELIQYGRQRDALEWAMKTGIWGHALMLSYKLDPTQHQKVMSRFLNSMSAGDPLQTAYTFLSGRQPNSLSQIEEGDLGSWREHLAMILSNSTQNQALTRNVYQRSITSLGDTLWNRGLLYASQFCYLLANGVKSFGYCNRKSSKIVLLGGDHTQDFSSFATLSAIQMTEVYEYAISLSSNNTSKSVLHSFQSLKYLYATWLVDYGLITQAFAYLEQIAAVVLQEPHQYHKTLVSRLTGLALRLQLHDQQRLNFTEEASAPQWLERLLSLLASDSAGEEKPTGIHTGAENEANLEAPALSSLAHAISSPREEVNEYEPKIDQSGRVSFSPDPTDSAPASARIPSRLSSTLSEQYIPAPHEVPFFKMFFPILSDPQKVQSEKKSAL